MIIYAVTESEEYESSYVYGYYTNLEAAKKHQSKVIDESGYRNIIKPLDDIRTRAVSRYKAYLKSGYIQRFRSLYNQYIPHIPIRYIF